MTAFTNVRRKKLAFFSGEASDNYDNFWRKMQHFDQNFTNVLPIFDNVLQIMSVVGC
jgi:hypothetical protein